MSRRFTYIVLLLGLQWGLPTDSARAAESATRDAAPAENPWWWINQDGEPTIRLYFFWTRTCPHCKAARPYVQALAHELTWVDLVSRELTRDETNVREFVELARSIDERAQSVPAFLFCGRMLTGYDDDSGMGATLRRELVACKRALESGHGQDPNDGAARPATVDLPALGDVDLTTWSLPLVAITLGALDSFNPCAFFVLLFLLSLLVNARSRGRMLLIGGLFVLVSGLVYFLFMAAWLNLFLLMGELAWITLLAGALAIAIGVLNVKDYFWLRAGPSLQIPRGAKPGLFQRMRNVVTAENLPALIVGTLVLAVVANAYELLCTAGFPMVFTRILTLEELPVRDYYAHVALYCLVYIVPLLAIVLLFVFTMGRRKLSEREGRLLKLISGLMMAALGVLLVSAPEALANVAVTAALLLGALALTWVIDRVAATI